MTLGMFVTFGVLGGFAAFVFVPSFQDNLKVLGGLFVLVFIESKFTGELDGIYDPFLTLGGCIIAYN